jgi:hypothetical protein
MFAQAAGNVIDSVQSPRNDCASSLSFASELLKKSIEHRILGPKDVHGSGIEQSGVDIRHVRIKPAQSEPVSRKLRDVLNGQAGISVNHTGFVIPNLNLSFVEENAINLAGDDAAPFSQIIQKRNGNAGFGHRLPVAVKKEFA